MGASGGVDPAKRWREAPAHANSPVGSKSVVCAPDRQHPQPPQAEGRKHRTPRSLGLASHFMPRKNRAVRY